MTAKRKWDLLNEVRKSSEMADIHYIRQKEPKGLGHAIWCARKFIGDEPFAVLLGDDIVESDIPCLKQMMGIYNEHQSSIVGVQPVEWSEVSRYGVVDATRVNDRVYRANALVEKPQPSEAPSNLAIMGRYILTPQIFTILEEQPVGVNGEIQLTDALSKLSETESIFAYHFDGLRHDVGEKFGFIKTTIHYALQHEELKKDLLEFMREVMERERKYSV